MKRTVLVLAVLLVASALAFAESSTITLQNQEQATFWFVVDPEELSDVPLSSPELTQRVEQFFAAQTGDMSFTPLAPDSQLTLEGLGQGLHLLVGFFDAEGADSLPVRALSVQVDEGPGDRFYALFSEPALVSVPRGEAMLVERAQEAPLPEASQEGEEGTAEIAQAEAVEPEAVEPEAVEPAPVEAEPAAIARFSSTYSPVVFTRESRGGFTVLPISQSLYWGEAGTRLDSLDGTIGDGTLRVSLRSANGFSRDVSYFFYLFASRTLGKENPITIELLPLAKDGAGACVLWQKGAAAGGGSAAPRIVGSVSALENACDLSIELSSLPAEVIAELGENASIDLCSCRYDAPTGVFEEFYFTTIQLADFGPSTAESFTR